MNNSIFRILQVSTFDKGGGAERIAWDLFTSYRDRGHLSWLVVGTKKSKDKDVFPIPRRFDGVSRFIPFNLQNLPQAGGIRRRLDFLTSVGRMCEYLKGHEDFIHPGTYDLLKLTPEEPDILHCHNLHGGYFDLRTLPQLSHQIPTVLTLHDAWLFSGHCAHSFECDRWKKGCGNCPYLSIYPEIWRDATTYNWQCKADIYRKSRFYVVTPSQWLMDKLNQSIVKTGVLASQVIPNGIDLGIFYPGDKTEAREELGIPLNTHILLFTANYIRKNIWKDYKTFQSVLEKIANTGEKMLCIALGQKAPPKYIGDVEIRSIPYQQDPKKVARFFQAADLYIHPARADTFPTTVLEALACGTPVVASAVGGIPEQIIDGMTGFLVPVGDAHAMAGRINEILADEGAQLRMGREAAKDAVRRFGKERMVNEYLGFYDMMLKEESI